MLGALYLNWEFFPCRMGSGATSGSLWCKGRYKNGWFLTFSDFFG